MSNSIKITKGFDIRLLGEADKELRDNSTQNFALKPPDFIGVLPKLLVTEGDEVKAGTQVFFDKYRENIRFTSPVSGKVTEIVRGAKRVILEVRIDSDGNQTSVDFGKADPLSLTREDVIEKMLESGVWPLIRQRPYSVIANPADKPKSVFISGFDSAPLSPDYSFLLKGEESVFQTGINALSRLTDGKIHLNINEKAEIPAAYTQCSGVQKNHFSGPHPAGNVGIQIAKINPINKGDIVWYLRPQEVIIIGRLFQRGVYDNSKLTALCGSELVKTAYVKTRAGASIQEVVKANVKAGELRYISGNVLTGTNIGPKGYLGFYDNQVTVIPEGRYHEFVGWALPGLDKFTFSKTFLSSLFPKKVFRPDTNFHGGERAFVMTGEYEKVLPLDIYPMHLLKAILIDDIDQMERLGIYEVDEEDFALCEVICSSKIEIQSIIRGGLDLMRREMS
ncbi:MAG: Na(+)-translocating NADH-quinone reductase subunit A [Bacteroidales bacterium]|nr:Na(+)-translocating NADH-quinone reductase subunit A [Bacteroidales bacterium]